ncbi:MAG: OmpA family protein [Acidobacteria bacterium]|nr:OmpA family protein [Acidobacteriota bacterium]
MARKKRHPEHENHERWLVSYADFITLLFAFFVVMFATSQVDSQKLGRFVESVNNALELKGPFSASGPDPIGGEGATSVEPPSVASLTTSLSEVKGERRAKRSDNLQLQTLRSALTRYLSRPEIRGRVRAIRDRRGLTLSLAETGLFAPGGDVLADEALPRLARLSELLYGLNVQILVEGHTDDQQVSSPRFPTNWDLSAARSVAVIRYLVETGHLPAYRFAAVGYGPYRPITPNDTPEGRARNRRVDLVLVGVDPVVMKPGVLAPSTGEDEGDGSPEPPISNAEPTEAPAPA